MTLPYSAYSLKGRGNGLHVKLEDEVAEEEGDLEEEREEEGD